MPDQTPNLPSDDDEARKEADLQLGAAIRHILRIAADLRTRTKDPLHVMVGTDNILAVSGITRINDLPVDAEDGVKLISTVDTTKPDVPVTGSLILVQVDHDRMNGEDDNDWWEDDGE